MEVDEQSYLLDLKGTKRNSGLSTVFAVICILDVFGVFPVVTLPKTIINCGYYGLLAIPLLCCTQIYTAALLGRCWVIAERISPSIQRKSRYPYTALVEISFGKKLGSWVSFLLDLTIFCGGIPNLIVASQNLQLLGQRISNGNVDISFCYWIIIVGSILCPISWYGSPKDMKFLCSLSAGIAISVFFLTCGCLLFSDVTRSNLEDDLLEESHSWRALLKAYGIFAFQFDIHPSILTIQMDMFEKSQITRALVGGFSVTFLMFGITTSIAFWKYGYDTKPSILETLPTTVPLHIAAAFVAIQLCLTSTMSSSALFQQMEDCMSIRRDFNPKRCVLRFMLIVLAVVIAESVPNFDLVMSIVGGTLTGPLVFLLPPLIFMKMRSLQDDHEDQLTLMNFSNNVRGGDRRFTEQKFEDIQYQMPTNDFKMFFDKHLESKLCIFIILSSVLLTVSTTYLNISSTASFYTNVTKPCIYNVSLALLYL
nr:amino acid transporter AVT1C-like [Leptinotarsa decemlineata]